MMPVNAKEPEKPAVKEIFDSKKEAKISEVKNLPLKQAVERLKGMDFLADRDLLNNAIFASFKDRQKEAVTFSVEQLKKPRNEIIDSKLVNRTPDLYVAKKILQMFPDESLDSLLDLYEGADPGTRANIIYVLGNMEGYPHIKNLLVGALDDKTFCQEEDPEMEGKPLRICDEAYNQLVLRYEIKNVLRTIGNVHSLEDRDYHIEVIKSML
jgi:hypothetical protein